MPSLKRCALLFHSFRLTLLGLASSLRALLTKADRLNRITFLGDNDMRLLRMVGRALGLIESRNTSTGEAAIFFQLADFPDSAIAINGNFV